MDEKCALLGSLKLSHFLKKCVTAWNVATGHKYGNNNFVFCTIIVQQNISNVAVWSHRTQCASCNVHLVKKNVLSVILF